MAKRPQIALKPEAMHRSSKSDYAARIMPDRASTGMGIEVPIASPSGGQQGRIPPAQRDYSKARYDVVDADEAMARMRKRQDGKMAPIRGGLAENGAPPQHPQKPQAKQAQARRQERAPDPDPDFDSFGDGSDIGQDQEPAFDDSEHEEPAAYEPPAPRPSIRQCAPMSNVDSYLAKRKRLTLELADTTLYVTVTDALVSKMSVTLLMPTDGNTSTFVPKPGSSVTITIDGASYPCYYPGVTFEIEPLRLLGLTFIRAEEG